MVSNEKIQIYVDDQDDQPLEVVFGYLAQPGAQLHVQLV